MGIGNISLRAEVAAPKVLRQWVILTPRRGPRAPIMDLQVAGLTHEKVVVGAWPSETA